MTESVLNYINGEWLPAASGQTFASFNPATGEQVASAAESGPEDVERAVLAARAAFDAGEWSRRPGKDRARVLLKLADLLEAQAERFGYLIAVEMGKPVRFGLDREVHAAVDRLRFFAGAARLISGEVTMGAPDHLLNLVLKEPVGVCGLIAPWNDPVDLPLRKIGAALAAGCTFVLKPSSLSPAATMELFKLFDQIPELPRGVANGVTGRGRVIGEALAEHPLVNKISFTGGTETGQRIMELSARNFKRLSLECGGKAPTIVFADANLPKALEAVKFGIFLYAGQSCTAGARLIVERSIHAEFLERLLAVTTTLNIGDPLDPAVHIGPMVSERQMQTVLDYVEAGQQEGARLIRGGQRMAGAQFERGWYVEPTIFDQVRPEMRIAREEIFGPVLSIIPFDDEAEALRLANDNPFGLGSAIWTNDVSRAIRVMKGVQAGDVWVNTHYIRLAESPFGGVKQSGLGRELGMAGVEAYLETKRVCIDTSPEFHIR
jgi:betaine-aldehyde dehydrogenase